MEPEVTRPPEPDWVAHAIWWHVYPLGAVGAFPADPPPSPDEHRLLRLVPWLDHVVRLGASGILLGPVFASVTHGYDTVDHGRLDPRLGEEADFDELVAQAHARGLRVALDGVFNHVSREHPLARRALAEGPASEAGSWFRWRDGDHGPELDDFEGHGALVALDHASPRVADLVTEAMSHWSDRGADAWRLDAAYAVPPAFWASVLPRVRERHPDVWTSAEVIHGDYAGFVAASGVDSVTQYELWKAIWSSLEDANLYELDHALGRHSQMLASFVPTTFVGNHDVTRIASRITDERHRAHAVVLLATLGGTPTVYAGDELGFRGVKEDRAGGDDAVRPPFPDGGPDTLLLPDEGVRRLHQELIGLRRRHPWLHRATSTTLHLGNRGLVVEQRAGDAALVVALNLDDEPLPLPDGTRHLAPLAASDGSGPTHVAPHGWLVLGPGPDR
ncbi:alpha-amylase family protein [Cellulomonas sp. DKR-3]|uniref:Alpha-amylase family protein n=1 Tax=Cellulomonas fulva TaxID=2835530 RepID=A0ABS5U105_9CELL|nr:alpha-amylase family protein [Cellulomonas fulva]